MVCEYNNLTKSELVTYNHTMVLDTSIDSEIHIQYLFYSATMGNAILFKPYFLKYNQSVYLPWFLNMYHGKIIVVVT